MAIIPIREPWSGTLTSRERFERQMHRRPVDRCFHMEFGYWDECFTEWPLFVEHGIRNNELDEIEFFGFDRIEIVQGTVWINPQFSREVLEERERTLIVRTKNGLIEEITRDGHASIPRTVGSSITTPEDWRRVKEERFRRDDPARIVDLDALTRSHPADREYPLGIHCGSMIGKVRDLLGLEGLAYAIYDHPAMVEDMVETCCLLVEDLLEQVLPRMRFEFAAGWEDIAGRNGPLVSLDFLRSVILPRYRRIRRRLAAAGIDVWYTDCDGDVRTMVPLMLEAGFTCLFPFEVFCSGHPLEVARRYGSNLRIMGGVDKRVLTEGRTAIRHYLESLAPLVADGGFIPFVDHRVPVNVNPSDYLYYLDTKESLFGMR